MFNSILKFISYTTNHDEGIFIGDEGVLDSFQRRDSHPEVEADMGIKIPCVFCKVTLDNDQKCSIYILDRNHQHLFDTHSSRLKNEALSAKKYNAKSLWKKYWKFVNAFHELEPSYAQTIHSSQGSTYQNVIVDIPNIMRCTDNETRFRLLYVAMSRPKNILMVNLN